jgi:hypothetical protein
VDLYASMITAAGTTGSDDAGALLEATGVLQ